MSVEEPVSLPTAPHIGTPQDVLLSAEKTNSLFDIKDASHNNAQDQKSAERVMDEDASIACGALTEDVLASGQQDRESMDAVFGVGFLKINLMGVY